MMEAALCSCKLERVLIMGAFPCVAWLQVGSLGQRLSLGGWEPPVSSASSCRIFLFSFFNWMMLKECDSQRGNRWSQGQDSENIRERGTQKVMPMGISSPFLCVSSFISLFRPTGGRGSFFPSCQSSIYFHSKHLLSVFCNWSPGFTFEHVWTSLILN